MTRAGRWFRNLLERLLGRFHEGPEPPVRISEEVRLFAALHPGASTDDWVRFATRNSERTYREAYIRGFEYSERFWPGPADDPEVVLAEQRAVPSLAENPRLRTILELGYDPADPFAGLPVQDRLSLMRQMQGATVVRLKD